MPARRFLPLAVAVLAIGCQGLKSHTDSCPSCEKPGEDDKTCHYDGEAKTLFSWALCKDEDNKDGGPEKVGSARTPDGLIVPVQFAAAETPGNGTADATGAAKVLLGGEPAEPDTITTDRPDFTEASTTVGRGRVQLEAGYTYSRDRADGGTTHAHSYPEMLLRIGLFAEWFELRLGQNFNALRSRGPGGATDTLTGATDLYIGTKTALTEQKGFLPEMAVIFQATVPTGSKALTGNRNRVLPGVSLLYGWDITDKVSLAGSVLGNKAVDDDGHPYTEFASSLSVGYAITDKVGSYFEYFGFYPHSATAAGVKPMYFLNGGLTYLMTNDLQFDVRAGFGLNRAADDFFTGAGFAYRY